MMCQKRIVSIADKFHIVIVTNSTNIAVGDAESFRAQYAPIIIVKPTCGRQSTYVTFGVYSLKWSPRLHLVYFPFYEVF